MGVIFSITVTDDIDNRRYTLTFDPNYNSPDIWLTNRDGEGMSVYREELFRMLDEHFRENF